jgi:hypothetical protein
VIFVEIKWNGNPKQLNQAVGPNRLPLCQLAVRFEPKKERVDVQRTITTAARDCGHQRTHPEVLPKTGSVNLAMKSVEDTWLELYQIKPVTPKPAVALSFNVRVPRS